MKKQGQESGVDGVSGPLGAYCKRGELDETLAKIRLRKKAHIAIDLCRKGISVDKEWGLTGSWVKRERNECGRAMGAAPVIFQTEVRVRGVRS